MNMACLSWRHKGKSFFVGQVIKYKAMGVDSAMEGLVGHTISGKVEFIEPNQNRLHVTPTHRAQPGVAFFGKGAVVNFDDVIDAPVSNNTLIGRGAAFLRDMTDISSYASVLVQRVAGLHARSSERIIYRVGVATIEQVEALRETLKVRVPEFTGKRLQVAKQDYSNAETTHYQWTYKLGQKRSIILNWGPTGNLTISFVQE